MVLWFKGNNERHPIYSYLKKIFPKLIITDNIEDFKRKYEAPKESFYVGKRETIWTMISKNNTYDFSEIWKSTTINTKFLEYIECFVFDPIETEKFKKMKSLVKISETNDIFDVLILSSKEHKEIKRKYYSVGKDDEGNGIFRYCYFIPKVPNEKARSEPKFKIDGYEYCLICKKLRNVKKLIEFKCRFCMSH
jgi:hypothetical protein